MQQVLRSLNWVYKPCKMMTHFICQIKTSCHKYGFECFKQSIWCYVCVQHFEKLWQWQVLFYFAGLMRANPLAALSLSVCSLSPLLECRHLARWTNASFDWQLHPGSQFTAFSERARNANLDRSDKKFPSKWNNFTTGNSPRQPWVFSSPNKAWMTNIYDS